MNKRHLRLMKVLISISFLIVFFFVIKTPADSESKENFTLTIAYTGECSGKMEPCGCSSEEIGGLRRRSGWVKWLRETEKDPVLLIDGGFASPKYDRQDNLKFQVYLKSISKMGYCAQFLGNDPVPENHQDTALLSLSSKHKDVSAFFKPSFNREVLIIGADIEASSFYQQIANILNHQSHTLVILMARGDISSIRKLLDSYSKIQVVIMVNNPQPLQKPLSIGKSLLLSGGNEGRYGGVLKLTVNHDGEIVSWNHELYLLDEKYTPVPEISSIYEEYKKSLKQENLLSHVTKKIAGIGFAGSESCTECHEKQMKIWKKTGHSHAYHTLQTKESTYDPECVPCHVVGFEYEEGFQSDEETPELKDVGCESCHGPSSKHVMNPDIPLGKTQGASTCLKCHEKERSPKFDYMLYYEKIRH